MKIRTEVYYSEAGYGRIEVRGNNSASGLFLDGKPFVFSFTDCAGSIGQDLYHFTQLPDSERLPNLSEVTANLPADDADLSRIVLPLLQQFKPGAYTLTLAPLTDWGNWVEYWLPDYAQKLGYTDSGYYPLGGVSGEKTLIATQPDETLSDERIAHFWYAIEAGARPFAITASVDGGMCEFVLDGHHKMRAYVHARVNAWRLCISRADSLLAEDDWPTHVVGGPPSWHRVHESFESD
ncbi:MAG: hypothetical protein H8F28_26970 [Fibrella sp.]|nr:hypothetical protein [Armatimonadota bacterium]